ncbi:hypothetical protein DMN91_007519 [Ooceraea biroi]|uniref:Heat shock protein 67B2 n=1 Tax=Ooceraea biroi TaxID=2015173 RepID=A0A026W8V9_OOCBI|nr:rhodanese domain-containing protein CG4456 [Ooceraea biroi]EZA51464.1 Heat shock protein 67B2 [Ooceraea biroi]RLU20905.1 hypothetical protein DMN91_007519 [Ooceraea biroi]
MYARFARRFSQGFVLALSRRDAKGVLETAESHGRFLEIISNRPIDNLTRGLHFSNLPLRAADVTMSSGKVFNVDYEQLLEAQKDKDVLIVDVREQNEINETGKLPGSIHIPMNDVSNVLLNLSEEAFREQYGKRKPTKGTKIILSCRSGRRSGMVQEAIQKLGYENAYNYTGGWLDWESKQKS